MTLVRPAARAALWRWREALVGLAAAGLGFYWAFGVTPGLLRWIGYMTIAVGAALIWSGVQRARFRQGGGGPGVVQVIEGRISYFGPLDGGMADLEAITALSYDPASEPPHWVIGREGATDLHVPATAEGADALFDAFSSLPGLDPAALARARSHQGSDRLVIWRRQNLRNRRLRLH